MVLIVSGVLLYCGAVVIGTVIPVHADFQQASEPSIPLYLWSNGIHTDFVVPVVSPVKDWSRVFSLSDIAPTMDSPQWIAFGWGDRTFYLETPTWDDLTIWNAFSALFLPTSAAMHVTVYREIIPTNRVIALSISEEQYQRLVNYIERGFQYDEQGNVRRIGTTTYYGCDAFYEARGTFHLFNTCNTWINCGLKESGLPAALWTVFDFGIFYHYQR
ncbi:MAG: TIGR02117 family protein [Bacteroidetes bacterium]|nr:TIGR02117 family protein [Bacteroidota bacterium]